VRPRRDPVHGRLARAAVLFAASAGASAAVAAATAACPAGTVYLTLDTGNMREAERIAGILRRHDVKATFFLANEKTPNGDHSLDDAWTPYWRARVAEGHAFGSHTFDHVYLRGASPDGTLTVRPQFGADAGRTLRWDARALCRELDRVGERFETITGRRLDPFWRAPGGKAPSQAMAAAKACGYAHVHWAPAGFLGDELPSDTYPNEALLRQSLATIRGGDILMAHLGIWSRRDPWAPTLDPLIAGLKAKGLCFATLREHPGYRR
jgi:peptidoglycan/xylan/chitin deacetylase (PgdA/CDA1 family)